MTPAIEELVTATNKVFEQDHLVIPEPSHEWKRKMEALEEARLERQKQSLIFDMRCWQAEQMGFKRKTSEEFVLAIMGEPHTNTDTGKERQQYEWFYNHHTDETLAGKACTWGGNTSLFYRLERKGFWYLPPFCKVEKWRCQIGKLDHLKREIPYGVVLRLNELKRIKLFNAFLVAAPMEAWTRKTDIDPIVIGCVWEVNNSDPTGPADVYNTAGQQGFYFIAQW